MVCPFLGVIYQSSVCVFNEHAFETLISDTRYILSLQKQICGHDDAAHTALCLQAASDRHSSCILSN